MITGAIAIGRNEGERLKRCMHSLSLLRPRVVYVDSGSTDGSADWVRSNGTEVVALDSAVPFTAARARNAGLRRLVELEPNIDFVQFIDGDCEIVEGWIEDAIGFLKTNPRAAVVFGRLRERHPDGSVYNWLCDQEWDGTPGETRGCGGNAVIRISAFTSVGCYRDNLIAGEEPELCVRLRAAGWKIWRLDREMALHDAAMTNFSQWWRRAIRGGYALAIGVHLHGTSPERFRVWESCRAWLYGLVLPVAAIASSFAFAPWGLLTWLVFPALVARQAYRNSGSVRERLVLASFNMLSRFPEVLGQLLFLRDHLLSRRPQLIEYKSASQCE
jgi:GT2 family glycosyltransferase